ncbi:hypothetical protein TSOC_005291 [Tetrabaena socialis]|uniref:Uncharacterized protein n=1 Tax=Tetrabaena socialis TaxID=47790 RepID=A0A2J8A6P8_9CHLO|nr:hypothetical protein TSOC_005291 [Tetrabaena socialis]|eukprot:PNH08206.1 hypothetical protein TSOC_005291 [Tetrabaena socialis]
MRPLAPGLPSPPGPGRLLSRASRLAVLSLVAKALEASAPAPAGARPKGHAAAAPHYPPRVQAVVEYVEANPARLQSIPMMYDADVAQSHLPPVVQGLTPEDVLPPQQQRHAVDPLAAEHYARVVAGLLYVACGGLDQAHNLVTPLCWGAATPYGGRPIAGSPAAADAAYVHALVHRAEGLHDGEYGSGFSNANYWYFAAGSHPVVHPQCSPSHPTPARHPAVSI